MHGYSHLLTGVARDLECVACLHIDDLGRKVSADKIVDYAFAFFETIGEPPTKVDYEIASETKPRRSSFPTFRKRVGGKQHYVGSTLSSITVTSSGFEGTEISDTWTPRSLVSVALHGKILKAFFQVPDATRNSMEYLINLAVDQLDIDYAAAYVFPFPWIFSPISYYSGLSYSPSRNIMGDITFSDSERIANWASHCYRGHRASEGYLREIYGENIIDDSHIAMYIGGITLEAWIAQDSSHGKLSRRGDKILWSLEDACLPMVQKQLDEARILLSAYPPEE